MLNRIDWTSGIPPRLLVLGVLFGVAVFAGRNLEVDVSVRDTGPTADQGDLYVPDYQRERGTQLVLRYIGSSACVWSEDVSLPDAVETIKQSLESFASERGFGFKAVGVAIDWEPSTGFEHLAQMGRFDEVSAGYNWGNSQVLEHVWEQPGGSPATPQVIVDLRHFTAPLDSTHALHYEESQRRTIVTKVGLKEITEWADAGVPISLPSE